MPTSAMMSWTELIMMYSIKSSSTPVQVRPTRSKNQIIGILYPELKDLLGERLNLSPFKLHFLQAIAIKCVLKQLRFLNLKNTA